MANIVDVAKKAGVSISTVSYVLSGNRPVSESTKVVVLKAMEETGYRPHAHARALASKRSRILALLIPPTGRDLGSTEFSLIASASEIAADFGYHLILWTSEYSDTEGLRSFISQGLVDGVILMEVHAHDLRVELLKKACIPFVLIGRYQDDTAPSDSDRCNCRPGWADIDFKTTVYDAVQHLRELGHKTIAFINQSESVYRSEYGPAIRTYEAFMNACSELRFDGIHAFCETDTSSGYETIDRLLTNNPALSAVISMNDWALSGVYRALIERGLHIPDDFSVLGIVTSSRVSQMFHPALTASEIPGKTMARIVVEQLIRQLENKIDNVARVLVPCSLVVRESTGPVRK